MLNQPISYFTIVSPIDENYEALKLKSFLSRNSIIFPDLNYFAGVSCEP